MESLKLKTATAKIIEACGQRKNMYIYKCSDKKKSKIDNIQHHS